METALVAPSADGTASFSMDVIHVETAIVSPFQRYADKLIYRETVPASHSCAEIHKFRVEKVGVTTDLLFRVLQRYPLLQALRIYSLGNVRRNFPINGKIAAEERVIVDIHGNITLTHKGSHFPGLPGISFLILQGEPDFVQCLRKGLPGGRTLYKSFPAGEVHAGGGDSLYRAESLFCRHPAVVAVHAFDVICL